MKIVSCLLFLALFPSLAGACNVPVFRYALERWQSDAYELVVFHDARLSVAQNLFLKSVEESSADRSGTANISLIQSRIAANQASPLADVWESVRAEEDAKLPYVVIRTRLRGQDINCWHGSLNDAMKADVLTSPARIELANRLLQGDAVVWLLLESDDEKRTRTARDLLQTSFPKLTSNLSLPAGVGLPGSELFSEIPLLLDFSVLSIDRNDEEEQFLVKLLSGLQSDAFDAGEPLIVPVFGRGRALEVIPACDLNYRLIEDLTVFLSGPCSCQVKNRNPGFDLLLSADWNGQLFGDGGEHPLATSVRESDDRPKTLTIPPGRKR